jgi:hypothetical protein
MEGSECDDIGVFKRNWMQVKASEINYGGL